MPDCKVNGGCSNQGVLLIWDSEESSPKSDWSTLLWKRHPEINKPDELSIVQLVDQKADELKAQYLSWIHDLGEAQVGGEKVIDLLSVCPGFSHWWISSLGQKFNCSGTSQINDAIKLLALEGYLAEHNFTKIILGSNNRHLVDCISDFCNRKSIHFELKITKCNRTKNPIRLLFDALPSKLKGLIFLSRYFLRTLPLLVETRPKISSATGNVMFIDVLVHLDKLSISDGRFRSNYWTALVEKLDEWGIKSNWAHLFFSHPSVKSYKQASRLTNTFSFSSSGTQHHILVERPLKFRQLIAVIGNFLKLNKAASKLQSISMLRPQGSDMNLWPLHESEWKDSLCGAGAMDISIKLSLFLGMLGSLPRQRMGVYIAENQPWEMLLIYAWKASGHGMLIGTPHTTIRYWDLRYFYDARSYVRKCINDLPLPDLLAVNGPIAKNVMISGGYPPSRVVEVEALRFNYLTKKKPLRKPRVLNSPLRVLMCGDFLAETNQKILAWLEIAAKSLPQDTIYIFKPHPAYPLKPTDYPKLKLEISEAPLSGLLISSDVAFTSNITSAAVDAYCLGVPVIQILDEKNFNTSPLRGLGNVEFVSNPFELVNVLSDIINTKLQLSETYFFIDDELPRWRRLLELGKAKA